MKRLLLLAVICFAPVCAQAMILYGLDNSANQTDPGTGLPFDSVGSVTGGSVVYLGNGYVLTANHVSVGTSVNFAGTNYAVDTTYSAVQVASGVDLKIFKLAQNPSVAAVNLFAGDVASQVLFENSYVVGWGVGRSASVPVNSTTVTWGDGTTRAHRWGLVAVVGSQTDFSYSGYVSDIIFSRAIANEGFPSSAALTLHDSGCGLFTEIGGTWYLTGLAGAVETNGSSTFGTGDGDANIFIDISAYHDRIMAIIPEPSTWGGVASLFVGVVVLQICRRKKKK